MTRRCGIFLLLHQCCMCVIDSKCCSSKNSEESRKTQIKLKLLQLVVIIITIASIESLLFYLGTVNVVREETFSTVNVNRATLILAFISTAILLFIEVRKSRKSFENPKPIPMRRLFHDKKSCFHSKNWPFVYVDFIHSFLLSTAFLSCAFWMIVDIPTDYKHHLEVFLKVVGYMLDLFIGVLYAKSCVTSYALYEETSLSPHELNVTLPKLESNTPPSVESNSEDEDNSHTALLSRDTKLNQGLTYTKLPVQ